MVRLPDRLSAPFGTVEKPVEVPSIFEERIVGVPDPEDDCLITWGIIKEGTFSYMPCLNFRMV